MTPTTQKTICFVNKTDCIVDLNLLERACVWFSDKPLVSKKSIFMYGKYPAVAIYKNKIHIHRLMMSFVLGRHLGTNEYVHHKNGNRLDCRLDNLQLIDVFTHQSMHNKGKKYQSGTKNEYDNGTGYINLNTENIKHTNKRTTNDNNRPITRICGFGF